MPGIKETEQELLRRIGAQETIRFHDDPEWFRDTTLENLMAATEAFFDYNNAIRKLEHDSQMACVIFPGDAVSQVNYIRIADMRRKHAHNNAIDAVNTMNEIHEEYGMEPFFELNPYDPNVRHMITSMSQGYVKAMDTSSAAHKEEQRLQAQIGDNELAQSRYEQDLQNSYKNAVLTNEATATETTGLEAFYWPERAAAMAEKDPNWIKNDAERFARKMTDKNAQERDEKRLKFDNYKAPHEPDDFQFE